MNSVQAIDLKQISGGNCDWNICNGCLFPQGLRDALIGLSNQLGSPLKSKLCNLELLNKYVYFHIKMM
jgi:hypothetical protein